MKKSSFSLLFNKLSKMNISKSCKICESKMMTLFSHTAQCSDCGVLLNFPYVQPREINYLQKKLSRSNYDAIQKSVLEWHIKSGARNHHNFTNMALFCEEFISRDKKIEALDYGGGGGQFALVLKSIFPNSNISIVDMSDANLLEQYKKINRQIKFSSFEKDRVKFDFIFLNDVFEHLTFPLETLKLLKTKLKVSGKIFIDTPCVFWLYPLTKLFSKSIYTKLLKGTVDYDHQQIWTEQSFKKICTNAGFKILKFKQLSEYTQPPEFYLNNMNIKNSFLRFVGKIFVKLSPLIARNKIMAVIKKY
jgi:2-polyprenyl-3-methyl-5-hydroxy-6-metoxy-1,4-benzoquinol methylase